MPNIIDLARDSLDKYCSLSTKSVFIIGALCASEKRTSHSCWIACSTSSWTIYSLTSLFMICCTLNMLGLSKSFTVCLIEYHIHLLSSQLHFCFIAVTRLWCFLVWASIKQLHRWTLWRPLACFLRSALHKREDWKLFLSLLIVNWLGCSICCCHANCKILPTFFALPSCYCNSWRYAWVQL